jgi:hypothetical protein
VTFYGAANPPATYGGVGGTTADRARYAFSVPSSWKEDVVSKTEKGASGVDSRFLAPARRKGQSIYVVTLRNEGSRDGMGFTMKGAHVRGCVPSAAAMVAPLRGLRGR